MTISDNIIIDYAGHTIKVKEPGLIVHESGLVFKQGPRKSVSINELYDFVKSQFQNDTNFPMIESTPYKIKLLEGS